MAEEQHKEGRKHLLLWDQGQHRRMEAAEGLPMVAQSRVANMGLGLGLHTKTREQKRKGMDAHTGEGIAVAVAVAVAVGLAMAMEMAMGWAVQREQMKNHLGETSIYLSVCLSVCLSRY